MADARSEDSQDRQWDLQNETERESSSRDGEPIAAPSRRNLDLKGRRAPSKSVGDWNYQTVRAEARKYKSRDRFFQEAFDAYSWARRNGKLDSVCVHMDVPNSRWTLATVMAEARKYKTRTAFQRGSRSAYNWARCNKKLDEVCGGMKAGRRKWDLLAVTEEAQKYETVSAFRTGRRSAYEWTRIHRKLDTVCAHMANEKDIK